MHLARPFTRAKCLAARREASARGVRPRLRHGRARKLGAARGEHVRFLVNAQCVGVPAVHAALLLAAPPALSLLLHALHAPLSSDNVYDVRRPTYDGAGAYVTRSTHAGTCTGSLVGGSVERGAIVVRRGETAHSPAVVLRRSGGRRCAWPVDAARYEGRTIPKMALRRRL